MLALEKIRILYRSEYMNKQDNSNTIEARNLNLTPPPVKELSQESLLEIALRHRWTILLTVILFLFAAFVYLLKTIPTYTSTARLYVEQSGPKIISEYEGVMTRSKNYLYTQSELIKSTPIVAPVAEQMRGKQFGTFAGADNIVAYLKSALNVNVGKRDDIITISFECPYPREAAQIVNAVVDSYIEYHSTHQRSTVAEVLKILQKEKVKRDKELSDKFREMLEFTKANGVVSFDNEGGHTVFQRLAKLSTALTDVQLATINAKADYEGIRSMAGEPAKIKQFAMAQPTEGVRVFINDEETQMRTKLKDLEVELKNAKLHCTEDHPLIQTIHTRIDYIQQQLDEQAKNFAEAYVEVMRQKWMSTKQREDELTASFQTQQTLAQNLGVKAAEYSVLQAELKRTERLCEILDNRIKELNVTEDAGALNISILEVARAADGPSKPQKNRVMAIALILGFIFGGGLAILRDWLDYRLRSTEEVSAILGIPVLGVIPTMSKKQSLGAYSYNSPLNFGSVIAGAYRKMRDVMLSKLSKAQTRIVTVSLSASGDSENIPRRRSVATQTQKTWRELKSLVVEIYRTICESISTKTAKSETRTITARLPGLGNSKTMSRNRAIANQAWLTWYEFKSLVSEIYKTIHSAMFADISRGKTKTMAVTLPASRNSRDTTQKKAIVGRGQAVCLEPKSIVAEAYRTVRTAVFFGVPKGGAKTILATSPAPGDGKTTLVSNLAITMAQAGQKTIIVDCDFRKPMQHNIFEIGREKGLSSVLTGATTIEEAIQRGPVDGLDILTCGPEVPNPSEMLNSDAFIETLESLSGRYDRVLIDSPPVAPLADSQILSAVCDVTLLVLRSEKSTRKLSLHARDSLLSVGGHLLGAIVNDVSRKHGRYGYYSRYGYGYGYYGHYGYGHSEKKRKREQKVYA